MSNRRTSAPRNLATLGLAISGPVALFSGIGVGVTLIAGPPPFLVILMLGSAALAVTCMLVLAADNAREMSRSDDD